MELNDYRNEVGPLVVESLPATGGEIETTARLEGPDGAVILGKRLSPTWAAAMDDNHEMLRRWRHIVEQGG